MSMLSMCAVDDGDEKRAFGASWPRRGNDGKSCCRDDYEYCHLMMRKMLVLVVVVVTLEMESDFLLGKHFGHRL